MTLKQCSNDPSKIISRELHSVCGVMFWAQDWIRMLRVHKNSSEGRKWFWPTTSDLCRILTHWCSEVGAWCLVLITRTQRPSLVQPWADYWPQDGGGLISTSWGFLTITWEFQNPTLKDCKTFFHVGWLKMATVRSLQNCQWGTIVGQEDDATQVAFASWTKTTVAPENRTE